MRTPRTTPWWRGWKGLVVLLVLALAGWGAWRLWFAKPPAPEVITEEARIADLEDTVLASGVIEPVKQVSVGAQVSGQVKRLHVALGDQVRQGQLIAEIDATTQTNALRNAEAALLNAQAQRAAKQAGLVQAELAFKREQQLIAQDATSREAFEAAQATYNTLKAELAAQDAQIQQNRISADTARVNLGYTRILAPMDGVVVAVVTEEGRTVNANQSAPTIIKLARLDTVTVKAEISEADVVRVRAGLPVYFTILGESEQRYEARLRAIEPVPESQQTETSATSGGTSASSTAAIYYNGLFDVPNPEGRLRPAMTAQVSIVLSRVPDALVIPSAALMERSGGRQRGGAASGQDARSAQGGQGGQGGRAERRSQGAGAALPDGAASAPNSASAAQPRTGQAGGGGRGRPYQVRVLEGEGEDARVVTRPVRIGLNNRVQAQVLEGLKPGEKVVVGEARPGEAGTAGNRRGGPRLF